MPPVGRRRSVLVARLISDHSGTSQGEILDELRRCLLDGEVPPGTPIPVDEVAEVFGVSRIPVRESLKTLIGEGLVDHRAGGGYRVATVTPDELREMYIVREVLETAALSNAVQNAGPADYGLAHDAQEALDDAIARGDGRQYHRESRRFHQALVAPARMVRLLNMFEAAWNITEPVQAMSHLTMGAQRILHADHEVILAAYEAKDTEALLAASTLHYSRLRTSIESLPRHSGLFTE